MSFPFPVFCPKVPPRAPPPTAWEQIAALADDDGWDSLYNFMDPTTRTLRNSGGNDFFVSVSDVLGNAAPLAQATEANQPQLVEAGGIEFAQFDGSNDSIGRAAGSEFNVPSGVRIALLVVHPTAWNNRALLRATGGGDTINRLAAWDSPANSWIFTDSFSAQTSNANGAPNTPHVLAIKWKATGSNFVRKNGVSIGTNSALGTGSGTGLSIATPNPGNPFQGRMNLLAFHSGDLTASSDAVTRMEALLMDIYGIS